MNFHPNEIVLLFDPHSEKGKQCLAYAKSINPHVREVDITNTKLTPTTWEQILMKLEMSPEDLMDKSSDFYQERIKGHDIDDMGLIEIIIHNPGILKGSIAVMGKKAVVCSNPTKMMNVR